MQVLSQESKINFLEDRISRKEYIDPTRRDLKFNVGDLSFLKVMMFFMWQSNKENKIIWGYCLI